MGRCRYCAGKGKSYSTTLKKYVTCDGCAGKGYTGWARCTNCNGTGKNYDGKRYVTCGRCGGTGKGR
ncbi:hypothetical protein [Arachnia propionica]|jgi:hypothetical protein|uniref:hypothetical protein n=1 Tax=Arachnia propionica TaxID=1750 RepID=UPI000F715163|nr:hypothetical protein [Arachnia propionica]VEJ60076.1 Uncharacterised protein [Arachnia propionica]